MENKQQVDEILSDKRKIYEERKIYTATFIGGPLVDGYMIANNFRCFGDAKKARQTWIYTIGLTLLLFIGSLFLQDLQIPGVSAPMIYMLLVYFVVRYYQVKQINRYFDQGGGSYGWGRTILVALIGLVILIPLLLSVLFILRYLI